MTDFLLILTLTLLTPILISDRSSPIWGDSPREGRVLGVNRGHMAGYASCWSTC